MKSFIQIQTFTTQAHQETKISFLNVYRMEINIFLKIKMCLFRLAEVVIN